MSLKRCWKPLFDDVGSRWEPWRYLDAVALALFACGGVSYAFFFCGGVSHYCFAALLLLCGGVSLLLLCFAAV